MPNLSTNKHAPALSILDIEEAVRFYDEGIGAETIARHFKVSRQAIYYHLRKRSIERRPAAWTGEDNPFWRGGEMFCPQITKIVTAAIQAKILTRPETCSVCGKVYKFKNGQNGIHGHHDDYNKPLEVRWLCLPCHHEWHKHNRAIPLAK